MIDNKDIIVDLKEVLRYINVMGKTKVEEALDGELEKRIDTCSKNLLEASSPKYVYQGFRLEIKGDDICFADIIIHSKNLAQNLKDCRECYMFACTIGPGADIIRQRANIQSPADSVIYQAVGAAMVESVADIVNDKIKDIAKEKHMKTRPRFSPGYGDFSLEHQRDFERLLNMSKEAGITLTDSLLLAPSKSVTAVIGLFEDTGE